MAVYSEPPLWLKYSHIDVQIAWPVARNYNNNNNNNMHLRHGQGYRNNQ